MLTKVGASDAQSIHGCKNKSTTHSEQDNSSQLDQRRFESRMGRLVVKSPGIPIHSMYEAIIIPFPVHEARCRVLTSSHEWYQCWRWWQPIHSILDSDCHQPTWWGCEIDILIQIHVKVSSTSGGCGVVLCCWFTCTSNRVPEQRVEEDVGKDVIKGRLWKVDIIHVVFYVYVCGRVKRKREREKEKDGRRIWVQKRNGANIMRVRAWQLHSPHAIVQSWYSISFPNAWVLCPFSQPPKCDHVINQWVRDEMNVMVLVSFYWILCCISNDGHIQACPLSWH